MTLHGGFAVCKHLNNAIIWIQNPRIYRPMNIRHIRIDLRPYSEGGAVPKSIPRVDKIYVTMGKLTLYSLTVCEVKSIFCGFLAVSSHNGFHNKIRKHIEKDFGLSLEKLEVRKSLLQYE